MNHFQGECEADSEVDAEPWDDIDDLQKKLELVSNIVLIYYLLISKREQRSNEVIEVMKKS